MQPILITSHYTDLYAFLGALMDARQNLDEQPTPTNSVIIWSQEASSALLDDCGKLQLVEKYARKMNLDIIVSAAADLQLRQWANQVGWQVLWDLPGLEAAVDGVPIYSGMQEEIREIAC